LEVYCKLKIHGNGNGNISCAPLLPVNLSSLPRIAGCHDLRALPEQRLWCFFSPVLRCLVVLASSKFWKICLVRAVPKFAGTWIILSPELTSSSAFKKIAFSIKIIPSFRHVLSSSSSSPSALHHVRHVYCHRRSPRKVLCGHLIPADAKSSRAFPLLLPASLLCSCLTSALLLMPRVPVAPLLVIALVLKSILAFRPVIGVLLHNPGVLFLLPRMMVVLAKCMFLSVVAVVP
jgi:hypothetical protein